MNINAKLAYNQLKINRSRTIWALIAIALSTALTTAVCSFVASGNAMLVDFYGANYGIYGSSFTALLLIPAVLVGIIIFSMSVIVVSNVFRVSAGERISQFGILKCVGATKNQIESTIMYESVLLSAVGIPVGIFLGLLFTFAGIRIANLFLDDFNSLIHMMINEITLSIDFVFSWQAVLVSAAICFLTVAFSAWLPAHKAAKVSAFDSVRGAGEIKIERKQVHTSPLIERFFGFEGTLAVKNIKRNRRNFRSTVIALSVGVILFISLSGLSSQANEITDYLNPDYDQSVVTEYISDYTRNINEITGNRETVFTHPINSELGNNISKKLEEFGDLEVFGMGTDLQRYETILPEELISSQMLEALKTLEQEKTNEFPVDIITLDEKNYSKLCEKAGVPLGSNILLNHYSYNDFGNEVNLIPFSSEIKDIELIKDDGSKQNIPIQGILTQEEIPSELFYININPVRLVLPQAEVRDFTWYCNPADIKGFIEYANKVMAQMFPESEDSSYMEEGFNTRVYEMDDYIKVMNIAIVLASIFMYSFVVLLMLIGFTNVFSTLSANVLMRSREFAVLKSVGMTQQSLKHMLNLESILYGVKGILYGLPIGIILTYLINLPIRKMLPIPYKLPLPAILLCVLSVFLITFCTTKYAAYKLRNQNIIETIRSESGR